MTDWNPLFVLKNLLVKATVKLRNTLPTTIAGVMAVTAYFVEHRDRYPCWIGGLIKT
jgi:hypothetical protein